ncbi:MAG: sporulation protein YhbH [Candidatus Levybacteria bacterium]|nr:sporulation protein YhbH [Candidatus Levybacteria bacterium]
MGALPEFSVSLTSARDGYWDLHDKGSVDQARHREKIEDAIKKNLKDIISQERVITSPDGKKFKVKVQQSLDNPYFIFDRKKHKGVGSGEGKPGDVIGREPGGQGPGTGPGAGDQPGIDYYEVDVSLEKLAQLAFADLGLPNLENKRHQELESEDIRFTDIRKSGPFANLEKKRTIKENIKRNAARGDPHFKDISMDDLRFRTWDKSLRRESNAVIFALMDVSGSMGINEKYIARTFYWWMLLFLRTKYNNVDIVFISHHTEAKEVSEEEFFNKGESGGTMCSSAYKLNLDIIRDRYNPKDWNIYPFHFSDGDNWGSDNEKCLELVNQLVQLSNQVGYGEIRTSGWQSDSTLMKEYEKIKNPKFTKATLKSKDDTYPVLRQFFRKETVEGAVSRA